MVETMSEPRIILNMIRTPDGKILVSGSVHDYKTYTDANGFKYMVDGGRQYLRRNVVREAPYEELSLYEGDPHVVIRESFTWGNRGVNGDQPLVFNPLKDLDIDHIKAIIKTQKNLPEYMMNVFKNELEYRNE